MSAATASASSAREGRVTMISSLRQQLAAEHGYGLTRQPDPRAVDSYLQHATSGRYLVRHERIFLQPRAPERGEAAVRRPRHRILVHAGGRRKETRNEIAFRCRRAARDDHAPRLDAAQRREVRPRVANDAARSRLRRCSRNGCGRRRPGRRRWPPAGRWGRQLRRAASRGSRARSSHPGARQSAAHCAYEIEPSRRCEGGRAPTAHARSRAWHARTGQPRPTG